MRRILHVICTVLFGMSLHGWAQTTLSAWPPPNSDVAAQTDALSAASKLRPMRLPPAWITASGSDDRDADRNGPFPVPSGSLKIPATATGQVQLSSVPDFGALPDPWSGDDLGTQFGGSAVSNALATSTETENPVRQIPSYWAPRAPAHRIVRYEIPLEDEDLHQMFLDRGIEGQLIEVVDESAHKNDSISERLQAFWSPTANHQKSDKIRVVRYEVPAGDIRFHANLADLDGEILEPGLLRLPEVRFFQPKARVFMDLKRSNDGEFDLFNNGAILASLDVIELYFPMPLISERFAEMFGKSDRLASLGWRVGGTLGLGITTALNDGSAANGSAAVSTISTGIRYEFPLGRPSRELLLSGDSRLDQRTRVGMEFGLQGGVSTRESLRDSTDLGLYFGILVNTPWGG